jgi:ketosteroid isomerase-like protein
MTATQHHESLEELADTLFTAIVAGDSETVATCFDPGAQVWHSFDRTVNDRDEVVRTLRWLKRAVPDLEYAEIRRRFFDSGWVQEHVMTGTANGRPVEAPTCMVFVVEAGVIVRMNEYISAADLQPLIAGA